VVAAAADAAPLERAIANAAQHEARVNARRSRWRERRWRERGCMSGIGNDDVPRDAAGTALSQRPHVSSMNDRFFPREDYFMRLALREAERALEHEDVPIGAVVVRAGEVISAAHNERELRQDPTAHAELLALRKAALAAGSWRVLDTVIYVTLEPCAMCAGAIVLARVPRVVYGAGDPKAGACGSVLDVLGEPRLNHRPEVAGGLLRDECSELLSSFFAARR
jgi:tRNA(adenine34) deaminase